MKKGTLFKFITLSTILLFVVVFSMNIKVNAAMTDNQLNNFYEFVSKEEFLCLSSTEAKRNYVEEEYLDYIEINNIPYDQQDFISIYDEFSVRLAEKYIGINDELSCDDPFGWFLELIFGYDSRTVKTPNNSTVDAKEYKNDYDNEIKSKMNSDMLGYFNNEIELISSGTRRYNCHSYALYNQDTSNNKYWIDDPTKYYEDGSYCLVEDGKIKPGDIICYYNNSKSVKYIHSGIVESVPEGFIYDNNMYNLDGVIVRSKWGEYGLYRHNVYNSPYFEGNPLPKSTVATEIRFYRLHNYDLEYIDNGTTHHSLCSACKNVKSSDLSHTYINREINNVIFTECSYCNKINSIYSEDFNCRTKIDNLEFNIYNNDDVIYEVNITCSNYYMFECDSTNSILFKLYDSQMNEMKNSTYISTSKGYNYWIAETLNEGKYYIKFDNISNEEVNISYCVEQYNNQPLDISNQESVNVLEHLHNNKNYFKITTGTEGFYYLNIRTILNYNVINSNFEICIKDNYGDIVDKNCYDLLNCEGINYENSNNILFYAEKWEIYTIEIVILDESFDEIYLDISRSENFNSNKISIIDDYLNTSSLAQGDSIIVFDLERVGEYDIEVLTENISSQNMIISVFESNESGEFMFVSSKIMATNSKISLNRNILQQKKIMLCIFNGDSNGVIDITIDRNVDANYFTIITDKTYEQSGSEVKLNEGIIGGTTITQGYTRICYLADDAPDTSSRLNYYWYSSDNSIAKISEYGTITAINEGTVYIQAVYKNDTSKIANIQITVVSDDNTEEIYLNYGMDCRVSGTISGSEVTSGNGCVVNVSENPTIQIHRGYNRLICLGDDSPNPSIQAFDWRVIREEGDTGMVTVSSYGTITATTYGRVIVEGTYKYNPRYKVRIVINVV